MSEQYLVDSKGLFGVAEFHRIVDQSLWQGLVALASATLNGSTVPPSVQKDVRRVLPLSVEEAQMVLDAHALIVALPAFATVPEAHDYKASVVNNDWGIFNGRVWYGAYIPVGFTSTLSFQARNKNISTLCTQWHMDTVEEIFAQFPSLLSLMTQSNVPHDPNNIKKIRKAHVNIKTGVWSVETYNPTAELAAGVGYAVFLSHQNVYYTGPKKGSPSLCGALMYSSVAAAERAMKSNNVSNYIVVKIQLEAIEAVVHGATAAGGSALEGAMALQQSKRLSAEVSSPHNTNIGRKKI